jgi:hypothetical protein
MSDKSANLSKGQFGYEYLEAVGRKTKEATMNKEEHSYHTAAHSVSRQEHHLNVLYA